MNCLGDDSDNDSDSAVSRTFREGRPRRDRIEWDLVEWVPVLAGRPVGLGVFDVPIENIADR